MIFFKDKIDKNAIIARSGVQKYYGEEIGLQKGQVYNVFRPKDVVKNLVEKLDKLPITYGHIDQDDDILKERQRGYISGVSATEKNGNLFLKAKMCVDGDADFLKKDCGVQEMSLGYKAEIEDLGDNNLLLKTIEPHHLAIVPRARGGKELKILDSGGVMNDKTMINDDKKIEDVVEKKLKTLEDEKIMKDAITYADVIAFCQDKGLAGVTDIEDYFKKALKPQFEDEKNEMINVISRAMKILPSSYDFEKKTKVQIIDDFLNEKYDIKNFKELSDEQKYALFSTEFSEKKRTKSLETLEKNGVLGKRPYEDF